jgi:hypothetical protein
LSTPLANEGGGISGLYPFVSFSLFGDPSTQPAFQMRPEPSVFSVAVEKLKN